MALIGPSAVRLDEHEPDADAHQIPERDIDDGERAEDEQRQAGEGHRYRECRDSGPRAGPPPCEGLGAHAALPFPRRLSSSHTFVGVMSSGTASVRNDPSTMSLVAAENEPRT